MSGNKRTLQGIVTSKSSAKTIKVRVETKQPHPLYRKIIAKHKNYLVHCENLDAVQVGDLAVIAERTPISKRKSWEFVSVVNKQNA